MGNAKVFVCDPSQGLPLAIFLVRKYKPAIVFKWMVLIFWALSKLKLMFAINVRKNAFSIDLSSIFECWDKVNCCFCFSEYLKIKVDLIDGSPIQLFFLCKFQCQMFKKYTLVRYIP